MTEKFNHGIWSVQLIGKSVFVYRNERKVLGTSISDYLEFARTNRLFIDYLKIKAIKENIIKFE